MSKATKTGRRELLFSVTRKDLRIDTFRAGGPGGQNQNKRETGVRVVHPESGAMGVSRTYRTQEQNLKAAFHRMADSRTFRVWVRIEAARRLGRLTDIEALVDRAMALSNLKIETRQEGRWVLET